MVDMYEEPITSDNCNYDIVEHCLSFGKALDKLIERENDDNDNNEYGIRIRTWNEGIVIRIQTPDENSKMSNRYLYKNHEDKNVPWVPNNEFIFNHFWEIVKFKNENIIPDKETIDKMAASMCGNKKYEDWLLSNLDIEKELDDCRRKCEELKKDYVKYHNLVIKDNNKCSPHCTKKCLNECHKAETKPNDKAKAIVIKGNVEKLVDTFDEIIDALLG